MDVRNLKYTLPASAAACDALLFKMGRASTLPGNLKPTGQAAYFEF